VLDNHESVGRLIADAGLESERVAAAPQARRRYLWKGGRLVLLPSGPLSFLTTPLFPAAAKFRLLREPWIGPAPSSTEESIAGFVRRRLGPAFLDSAVGPFVSGVYAGDPERLSVRWAVPKIHALERDYGSLIRGALAKRKGPQPGGGSAMVSFRGGLEELPRRLAREIGDVRAEVACRRLLRSGDGFTVETSHGSVSARRVVLAVPAEAAAALLAHATEGASLQFAEIPYAPVAVVSLGWRRADVAHPLDGFGFLVPRVEGLRLLGCLFTSSIFPDRAPEGQVALSAFLGGATDSDTAHQPDERIHEIVETELRLILGLRGEPAFRLLRRWPRAIPQYELGHGRFLHLAREIEGRNPGLHLGGNWLAGVSVPDCIRNSTVLAEEIERSLR
jgi:oxygen-dependent protoporphyrinogen oxidase